MDDLAIICNGVIDADVNADAELSHTTKQVLMKRKQPAKHKSFIFYLHFS